MRRLIVAMTALVTVAGGLTGVATAASAATGSDGTGGLAAAAPSAQPFARASQVTHRTLPKQIVRAGGPGAKVAPQQQRLAPRLMAPLAKTANITVTYTGFPNNAEAAFQAAVDVWATQIRSSVPIHIEADWSNLDAQYGVTGVLGAAGPTDFVANFAHAPKANVFYPVALANAISGSDLEPASSSNPSGAEISASFNSAFPAWYFGTDGHPGGAQYDLETVVLHELGHGLGFLGTYDGLNPNTYADQGRGYFGLSLDGKHPTVFDTFVTDGNGLALGTRPYTNGSLALGAVLRGAKGGVRWNGPAGIAAAGCGRPVLYAPGYWQEGSSFSHLDEDRYPEGTANALMSPMEQAGEADHAPGAIVLGMFQDMGWPTTPSSDSSLGTYFPAWTAPVPRLLHQTGVTPRTPLTVQVTGRFGVPYGVRAVAVNVEVKNPTATKAYWSVLPSCRAAGGLPSTQAFTARQTRTSIAVLPVDSAGRIMVSISSGTAEVNVDLLGYYAPGGLYYHHLQDQKVAVRTNVSASRLLDVPVLGRGGIPASGVSAVVLKARVSGDSRPGWLLIGPGGTFPQEPTLAFARNEMRSALAVVPLPQSGSYAGKLRLRLSAGTALVSLEAVGWYGASPSGGKMFHPAGPARDAHSMRGSEIVVAGMPANSQVMLDVHMSNPTAFGWLGSAPAGHPTLHGIQEYYCGVPVAGTIVTTTNGAGQVRLHMSAGLSTMYVDYLGWFSAS